MAAGSTASAGSWRTSAWPLPRTTRGPARRPDAAASSLDAPGVGEVARPAARQDQHHVEPRIEPGKVGARAEELLERAGDAAALARGERLARGGEIGPRLHLDRRQHPAAPRDQVDLARRHAIAPRQDAPAAAPERPEAEPLGENAAPP